MTDKEVMQMALDAMVSFSTGTNGLYEGEFAEEIAALCTALAQPEQEPVAWVEAEFWDHLNRVNCATAYKTPGSGRKPLYTSPHSATHSADSAESFGKPQREWRSLTSAQRKVLWNLTKKPSEYGEMIDAKLRELNT